MSELVEFAVGDQGQRVVVEVDDDRGVVRATNRVGDGLGRATAAFETGFAHVRDAAAHALAQLSALPRRPDTVELEFGIKLSAEAGAILARTGTEGHLKVRMVWEGQQQGDDAAAVPQQGEAPGASGAPGAPGGTG